MTATPMSGRGVDGQGRRYWRARTTGASRRTVWTGWATRAEVQRALVDLLRRGIPAPRAGHGAVRTVGDLLVAWCDHQQLRHDGGQIATRTIANYRQVSGYWRAELDEVLVRAVTRHSVEDVVAGWLASGVAPRTCALALEVLVAAWRWGAARGHCLALDLTRLSVLRIREDEHVAVATTPTRAELGQVLERVDGWYRDLLHLQALTGARIGEVVALRVGDWDHRAGTLALSGRDDERERRGKVAPRRWPVLRELGEILERLAGDRPADERLVLGVPRQYSSMVSSALRRACDAADVPRFTTHGIRRRVAMDLLDAGVDARTVAELTGHSVQVLLASYVRPTPERMRSAVARSSVAHLEGGRLLELVEGARAQIPGTSSEDPE